MTSSCFTSLACSCKSSVINCLLFHWFVNVISEIIKTFITLIAKKWDSILFFDRNAIYAWVKVFESINLEIFEVFSKLKRPNQVTVVTKTDNYTTYTILAQIT